MLPSQVEAGVDPKSMFCQFFKQGLCKKGDKCKFSHDPDVERKAVKRNVYEEVKVGFVIKMSRYAELSGTVRYRYTFI